MDARQKVWAMAFCAAAGAQGIATTNQAIEWADIALQAFDKRWPEETKKPAGAEARAG